MRAFYLLVNGLRQQPNDEHALNMLVELYIREIDSPGVERDLLVVLEVVPDGLDIYEMIHASLEQSGDERRLKSLIQTRDREGRLPELAADPSVVHHGQPQFAGPDPFQSPGRETRFQPGQSSFARPPAPSASQTAAHRHSGMHSHSGVHRESGVYRESGVHRESGVYRDIAVAPAGTTGRITSRYPSGAHRAGGFDEPLTDHPYATGEQHGMFSEYDHPYPSDEVVQDSSRETATTGVFSSINVYLSEQHAVVAEEIASRSKRRLIWIGAVIVAVILLLMLLVPSKSNTEESVGPYAPTPSEPAVEITEPLPKDR